MRLPVSVFALIIFAALLLAAPLPACSPRSAGQHTGLPELRWEPDEDVNLTYGILLLDQAMRDSNASMILEAVRQLAEVSPISRPFVDAAAWLLLNRSPALTRAVLEPAIRRFPDDINPHLLMAEAWFEDNQPDQALTVMKAYSAAHPDSIQARQELAVFYTKAGNFAQAEEAYATLPPKAFTPFVRFCHGRALAGLGRKNEAIRELRKVVEDMPDFIDAWSELARLYESRKEYKQAAAVYEHILEQEPANQNAWLRLIATYIDSGEKNLALDVARTHAEEAGLAFSAIGLFMERKLYMEAEALLQVLRQNPDSSDELYFYLAAAAYEGRNDIAGALNWLAHVTLGNRFYERALRFRAQLLFESKRRPEALDTLHEAQTIFPEEPVLYMMEAHFFTQDKEYDAALAVLDRAVAQLGGNLDLLYARGMTLDQAGRKAEAFSLMEQLIAENAEYYQALNYVGYSLAEQKKDLPRALALLHKANELSPDAAYITDSLAWAQFQAGQLDAAWTSIQRATQLEGGDDAVIWEHYGDIAAAKGKREEARRGYTNALKNGHEKPDHIREKMKTL